MMNGLTKSGCTSLFFLGNMLADSGWFTGKFYLKMGELEEIHNFLFQHT